MPQAVRRASCRQASRGFGRLRAAGSNESPYALAGRAKPMRSDALRQVVTERAMRKPTSSIRKVGWLRRRTEARQLQCSSNQPPPRSTR